jgi:hypothetical protein
MEVVAYLQVRSIAKFRHKTQNYLPTKYTGSHKQTDTQKHTLPSVWEQVKIVNALFDSFHLTVFASHPLHLGEPYLPILDLPKNGWQEPTLWEPSVIIQNVDMLNVIMLSFWVIFVLMVIFMNVNLPSVVATFRHPIILMTFSFNVYEFSVIITWSGRK